MRTGLVSFVLFLCGVALAQSAPSYRLEESTMNAGGHPREGLKPSSTSYEISLDAIGSAPVAPLLQSTSYSMTGGFARSYPPPREVRQLAVNGDKATFVWAPERSVGSYQVYRGELNALPFDYGTCRVARVAGQSALLDEVPEVGEAFFFLVTAENMLLEEGVAGFDSAGGSRVNSAPCP